ncbi:hypothetical protein DRW03_26685 [Corallococcus sp. H22C18031201]|uniref:hypothetical protein n=1 Tax=Citreicoccus inhibens TaxID=2849499 RepID=UPI000E750284|nr:hypothetical protein [Citreicoccus inhibens]MBU8899554.1 hypothetical protein [Citreicoccus inhibens]RJS18117.1 hypothetical protein DRW03_26685 [Corallococcus sp. H22C18031201]
MNTLGMFAAVVVSSMAIAQAPPAPPGPAPVPRPTTAAAVLDKASEVPDPEKLQRSNQALGGMREVLRQVLEKVEEARRSKDVVKLNCANEKLTQIKGLLRISEQADVSLQESISRQEASSSEHEYTKVMIAQQKVGQLRAEAEECIGQLAFRTDENLFVEVEEPNNLPGGDPTRPLPPQDIVVRPPPASPVR